MPDPILARLDKLHNQWVSFADDPHARLLIWRARHDERSMVDAFVGRECDPDRAETPDLFLQLLTPWTGLPGHGARLAEELSAQAQEADVAWQHELAGADIDALLSALESLRVRLEGRTLAVWLEPSAIEDGSYLLWLQRLVHATPAGLRFFVVGEGYGPLARAEPQRVREFACALDMPGAFVALTDRAGGATPDGMYRRLQAQLNAQLATGDLVAARATSERALALCAEQGWPQLAAALHLTMGSAFGARAHHAEAVAAYREADRDASKVEGKDGERLRVIALLGCGGALFAAGAYGPACDTYVRTAVLAEQLADARSELDAYRMAAVCCAELGQREQAWKHGVRGLRAAAKLPADQRALSTLCDLAGALRRLFAGDARVRTLEQQLASLNGA